MPKKDQDEDNQENSSKAATWVITPVPAVRPRREAAEEKQNKKHD